MESSPIAMVLFVGHPVHLPAQAVAAVTVSSRRLRQQAASLTRVQVNIPAEASVIALILDRKC
jgi:hypothetical protein